MTTPTNLAPNSEATAERKEPSVIRFRRASSVSKESCGSSTRNIRTVATPLIMEEREAQVTLKAGSKAPAYNAAKTPIVQRATAKLFKISNP